MNNTINKIKLFFKGKPARIIIALLVIAAIMTGVAFGVIALVNALSDPCEKQPGKEWNNDLKKCVLKECPDGGNLCKVKGLKAGNCIPKDYCKEYEGAKYRYDPDTCECTIDCPNDEEKPFTKHGDNITKFENGKPTDPLTCGIKCDYNTKILNGLPGGYKWCPSEGYWCGQLIYKENVNDAPGQGCWEKSRFNNCSEDIVCPTGVTCVSNSKGEPRCMPSLCSGEENNEELVYACLNDDDCIDLNKSYKSDINPKCITGELASNDEDKKFTHFKQVGYCSKTNKFKDNNCTIKRLIGETPASTNDDTPVIKICENIDSSVEGISTFNPQCDTVAENGCANFGICPNEWQGKSGPSDNDPHCVNPKESIEEARNEMEYHCCDNQAITPAGNKFCCPHKTFSDPEFGGHQLCTLNTKFGYSKKHLDNTASLSETLSCSVDEDCFSHNEEFYKVLGITQSEAEDKTNSNFSSLYCDKNDNVCKAFCGFYDATSQLEDNFGKIDISISSSSEEEQYSFCFPKDSCELTLPKITKGIDLKNGWPACQKTQGNTTSYRWSGTYGDGYEFGGESSLKGDCSDKASINTCMNALGKSNYHINDVYVKPALGKDKGKCGFSAACDQLEITTDNGTVSWTSAKEYTWANSNKKEFIDSGIGRIAQTANPKNAQTGIQNYATALNEKCIGITNSFDEEITINPFSYIPDVNSCTLNESNISKLRYNGEYCMNGVDPIGHTGDCLDKQLDCKGENRYVNTKENFGNIDTTKKNKKTNSLSYAPSPPPALQKNNIFGLVDNKKTNPQTNEEATIQDSKANKFSCADMQLSNDGKQSNEKTLKTELPDKKVKIRCSDDECGHGNIKCFDAGGNQTACCGSYDAKTPYTINYDSKTKIYSCAGGLGNGWKAVEFPDYDCVISQDGWTHPPTSSGYEECLKTLNGGGYYCNGAGPPGRIIRPTNNMNIMSNKTGITGDSGMKGTTGCKWTVNAYFDDASSPEWSQANLTLPQCNIMCSQKLEGRRNNKINSASEGLGLDFSKEQTQWVDGPICGWMPTLDTFYGPVGLCSIKPTTQVIGDGKEDDWYYGRYLTQCNDVSSTPLKTEDCGFVNCLGKALNCRSMCNPCGDQECCLTRPGEDGVCCGTNWGDGYGVTGCGAGGRPECLDNNFYPCIYNKTIVAQANTALDEKTSFIEPWPYLHRTSCP
jgi:hypothetical protein